MLIRFKTLQASNFLSLSNISINFEEIGFTLIEGINQNVNDNAKSNGSGKSSIFEAILWALTGDTLRNTNKVVNFNGDDGAIVELTFDYDSIAYKLIRSREHSSLGTNLKIYKGQEDLSGKGIRESERILEALFPELTSNLIGSVILLGQGLPQRFTNNTPAGRKDILEKLSKSDYMIEDVKSKLTLRKNTLLENEKAKRLTLQDLETKLNISKRNIDNAERLLAEETNLVTFKEQLTTLEAEQIKLNSTQIELEQSLETIKTKINSYDKELQEIYKEIEYRYEPQIKLIRDEITDVVTNSNVLRSLIKTKNNDIESINSIETICRTCKRPYDDVHKPDTKELELEVESLNSQLTDLLINERSLSIKIEDIQKSKTADKTTQSIEVDQKKSSLYAESRQIESELSNLKYKYSQNQSTINKLTTDITRLETIKETQLDLITFEKAEILKNTSLLENETQILNDTLSRLEAVSKLISLAQRDFRTYLLEDVVKYTESRLKHYSKRFFKDQTITFNGEDNNIFIGLGEKPYEGLSGGEKQKLDLAIQFSLRDMLITTLNFDSNILVLDEVFDNLDEVGCNNLIDLILNDLQNVETVYIITHHADISIPYDNRIVIIKDNNGNSKIMR